MPFLSSFKNQLAAAAVLTAIHALQVDTAEAKKIDGNQLLAPDRLVEIRIELAPRDWSVLCRQSPNPNALNGLPSESPYTYFKADLWIDDQKIESVGVRKKGFFGSADFQRPSLKVKFDKYVKQAPVKGLSRLTLNNNKQDQSQVSQYLTYKLFRDAGNPAPRSNLAHVTVNGRSLGIYSNVESIKKPFLKRWFEDKSGNLYEGALTDFHPQSLDYLERKTNEEDDNRRDIERLAELLANDDALNLDELQEILKLDTFFRHWAIEAMTGFWDGYASNQNNYYLYFNPKDDRGYFIPWGADYAFTSTGPMSFGRGVPAIYAQSILTNRLYNTRGVPARYRETMRRLLDEVWNEKEMIADVDRIEKLVTPYLHQSQSTAPQAMKDVRQFIRGRRAALDRALANWRPFVPPRPRMPKHLVDIGTAKGTFSTVWTNGRTTSATNGKAKLELKLGDKFVSLDQVSVRVQPQAIRGFGGRGFGGPGRGGLGGPATNSRNEDAPINLVIVGTRIDNDQPITLSMTIDRESFGSDSDASIDVNGRFTEGRGASDGFAAFGGGSSRYLTGHLRLADAGTIAGDTVAGRLDVRIVETRGGVFGGNSGGGRFGTRGGSQFGNPGGNQRFTTRARTPSTTPSKRSNALTRAIAIFKQLDKNEDGKIERQEWANSDDPLGEADADSDSTISLAELLSWLKKTTSD